MKNLLFFGKIFIIFTFLAVAFVVPVSLIAGLILPQQLLHLPLGMLTIYALPALFMPHFFKIPLKLAMPFERSVRDLDLIVVIMTVGLLFSGQLLHLLPGTRTPDGLLTDYTVPFLALMGVFSLVVAAPVSEELLFRGTLWKVAEKTWSPTTVLVITSVLFMLPHADRGITALPFFLIMGIWLGWLRRESRSLVIPILAHAAFNGLSTLFTILNFWPRHEIATATGLTIVALGLMLIRHRSRRASRPSSYCQPS